MTNMPAFEPTEPLHPGLAGRWLDRPGTGGTPKAGHPVTGWALGRDVAAVSVEFLYEGEVFHRAPLGLSRPDVAAAYPHVPWAGRSGFRTVLQTPPGELELELRAVLSDQARVPFGSLRFHSDTPDREALISVVIPCHNQAHFLADAIESVLAQSYPHHEIVVVDDGSTDNTWEVAGRYPGVARIHQSNKGLAAARNAGFHHARGEYLVFLDADDRLLPEALATGYGALQVRRDCAFVSGHHQLTAADGSFVSRSCQRCVEEEHYDALLRSNYIAMHATVMYRRTIFASTVRFNPSLRACEDYDVYLRVARTSPICCHHEVVAEYRRHGRNMSRNPAVMLHSGMQVLRLQRPFVRERAEYRHAYQAGRTFLRDYYGRPLVAEIPARLRQRRWRDGLDGFAVLARDYPQGLARLVRRAPLTGAGGPSSRRRWLRRRATAP